MKRNILLFFALALFVCLFASCGKNKYLDAKGMVWNTTYSIVYESDRDLSDSIVGELRRVEKSVSAFDKGSVVSLINSNSSDRTDPFFRIVYNTACAVNKYSNGSFDPTLAPLINAYGFGYEKTEVPDSSRVAGILQYVGIEKTSLKGDRLVKSDARIEFNFSAIAKGFGCDCVADMFERNGITDYMVEIGGEIRMAGNNPRGEKWNISIDKPVFSNNSEIHESQTVVSLSDCGMATSGNYRNFKDVGGKRVVHTIDRFTGMPAINDLLSVTIVIPKEQSGLAEYPCMLADAYATACMSMGSKDAKAMIQSHRLAAMLIMADGSIWESDWFPKGK